MLSHKEYSDYIIRTLDSIPQKYNDKNKEIAYRYGLLVGIVARLMNEDSLVGHSFHDSIKKLKIK